MDAAQLLRRVGTAVVAGLVLWGAWSSGGCSPAGSREERDRPRVAAGTSWLACAVRDVAGDAVEVVVLSPPGRCPGHFDMTPSQLAEIRTCRMLVRFDFQKGLDDKLARIGRGGMRIVEIAETGGLCEPDTYLSACSTLRATLVETFPEIADDVDGRLSETTMRMKTLTQRVRDRVRASGASGAKTLTSMHQASFARWLGLEVTGTFRGADSERPATLDALIRSSSGVRFVIANRQEGERLARRLAERLDARLVVFSNFPDSRDDEHTFDDLMRHNVDALLEDAAK